MDLPVGTVVARSYEILGPLGRGGMGELFVARNVRTERRVALKMLRPDAKQRQDAIERFRREARATGMVSSDHVTQVLDVEEDPVHGIAIAFELLEGESLLEFLRRTGTMSPEALGPIIRQILRGLADAHSAGVIHRDLKPSNIFLERRPDGSTRVKILDFGISKLPRSMVKVTLTEPNQSLGSFMFMPPEQIQGAKDVDERADIYAMGTLVFQSLTGQLPFASTAVVELVRLKTGGRARTLRDASGRVFPEMLEAFVAKCLQPDRGQRFQTVREMMAAWEIVVAPVVPTSTNYPPSSAPRSPPRPSAPSGLGQTVPFRPADLPFPTPQGPSAQAAAQAHRDDMAQTIALPASSARPMIGRFAPPPPAAGLPPTTVQPLVAEHALSGSYNPYAASGYAGAQAGGQPSAPPYQAGPQQLSQQQLQQPQHSQQPHSHQPHSHQPHSHQPHSQQQHSQQQYSQQQPPPPFPAPQPPSSDGAPAGGYGVPPHPQGAQGYGQQASYGSSPGSNPYAQSAPAPYSQPSPSQLPPQPAPYQGGNPGLGVSPGPASPWSASPPPSSNGAAGVQATSGGFGGPQQPFAPATFDQGPPPAAQSSWGPTWLIALVVVLVVAAVTVVGIVIITAVTGP